MKYNIERFLIHIVINLEKKRMLTISNNNFSSQEMKKINRKFSRDVK